MDGIEYVEVSCPCCGEPIELAIDTSVTAQEYVEDCTVCCQPIVVSVAVSPPDDLSVSVEPENG